MAKNGDNSSTKKTRVVKKSVSKSIITKEDRALEKLLIENFISMQNRLYFIGFLFKKQLICDLHAWISLVYLHF